MPSQSRSEGDSTLDHWMTTESPDRFRDLGDIDKVDLALAEERKRETKRMKVEKSTIMAIKCDATEESKNNCRRRRRRYIKQSETV